MAICYMKLTKTSIYISGSSSWALNLFFKPNISIVRRGVAAQDINILGQQAEKNEYIDTKKVHCKITKLHDVLLAK